MAELVVKVRYESSPRKLALSTLRLLFPFWGILGPIVFLGCIIATISMLFSSTYIPTQVFGVAIACLALPLICLCLSRLLTRDSLVLDVDGIQLPFSLLNVLGQKFDASWHSISRIAVIHPPVVAATATEEAACRAKLLLFSKVGGPITIDLSRMKLEDVEQTLLAIETWGTACERDSELDQLKLSLKNVSSGTNGLSYTDMWEDELRRRFCATAFVPLVPERSLKDGRLRVVRQLALGGLSAVYLCQLDGQKLVVLKEAVIPDDAVEHVRQKAVEMFKREAAILLTLDHPNIVKVLEYFFEGGRNYLMLEYVNGQDIRQFVRQNGSQRESVVIDWAIQICGILKFLHEQDPPIIHRDLTPDNLVLKADGSVVLIDFGAANELLSTATGTFVGKQSFIAPEQFRGKALTQSDIYALGGTMFYMLTGQEPEALSTSNPQTLVPSVSSELAEVVECCTQMEAIDRYQSVVQLLPVLRRIAASLLSV